MLTMLASAMPTSMKRSGKLFWNVLMPVEPCTSDGDGEDRVAVLGGADGGLGQARSESCPSSRRRRGAGAAAALAFFAASFFSQSVAQRLRPVERTRPAASPAVDLVDELDDLLAVGQREAVAAGRVLLGGLDAVALDGLAQQADRLLRIGLRLGDGLLRAPDRRPADRGRSGTSMTCQPSAPIASKVGCIENASFVMRPESLVSLSETIRTNGFTRPLRGQAGNRGEGFLGLAFHRRAVGDDA